MTFEDYFNVFAFALVFVCLVRSIAWTLTGRRR